MRCNACGVHQAKRRLSSSCRTTLALLFGRWSSQEPTASSSNPILQRALEPTITAVEAGQIAVPAERRRDVDRPTLSRREKQTLGLVVMGLSNREIASRLFVAESTVKCHLSAAFVKLGVRSRHEAVSVILDPERGIGLGILRISEAERRTLEARS